VITLQVTCVTLLSIPSPGRRLQALTITKSCRSTQACIGSPWPSWVSLLVHEGPFDRAEYCVVPTRHECGFSVLVTHGNSVHFQSRGSRFILNGLKKPRKTVTDLHEVMYIYTIDRYKGRPINKMNCTKLHSNRVLSFACIQMDALHLRWFPVLWNAKETPWVCYTLQVEPVRGTLHTQISMQWILVICSKCYLHLLFLT
jgi:hypothetical protein